MEKQLNSFCVDLFNYNRRKTSESRIGNTPLGADNPIRIQSMTNTDTNNVEASVNQAIAMIQSGAEYVRLTTQGVKEAENMRLIKEQLEAKGYTTPLVADIHFNPKAATVAAKYVEKIRINPGNFVGARAKFEYTDLSDEEFNAGLEQIKEKFIPLLDICKAYKTAIRIGTNHGSLSDRIMSRYGDSPEGMVAATMEFLRICKEQNFTDISISIKSSNTVIMVKTVRKLVEAMNKEQIYFPLHLGVTEAGEGEDGRIKSAVGTGALLNDGIGDTVRISLTENPEIESPVGKKLVDYVSRKQHQQAIAFNHDVAIDLSSYYKRKTLTVANIGADKLPVVIANLKHERYLTTDLPAQVGFELNEDTLQWKKGKLAADYVYVSGYDPIFADYPKELKIIVDSECWQQANEYTANAYPLFEADDFMAVNTKAFPADVLFVLCNYTDLSEEVVAKIKANKNVVVVLQSDNENAFAEQRASVFLLEALNCKAPVILQRTFFDSNLEDLHLKSGCDLGSLFFDGLGNGISIENGGNLPQSDVLSTAFGILQAARVRTTKTEFVSCPGCGRTLFNLQDVVAQVKKEFAHLTHLKIGVMGCIVNGPGEMGDVDYGYVGSGVGRVSLYKGQTVIQKNIESKDAIAALKNIIKEHGDWVEN